jgi:hypothetical protein
MTFVDILRAKWDINDWFIIRDLSSLISHLSFLISHFSSLISHLSSLIFHLSSFISHLSSVIGHLQSIIYNIHSGFSVLCSLFYILYSAFCILYSAFCILHSVLWNLSSLIYTGVYRLAILLLIAINQNFWHLIIAQISFSFVTEMLNISSKSVVIYVKSGNSKIGRVIQSKCPVNALGAR